MRDEQIRPAIAVQIFDEDRRILDLEPLRLVVPPAPWTIGSSLEGPESDEPLLALSRLGVTGLHAVDEHDLFANQVGDQIPSSHDPRVRSPGERQLAAKAAGARVEHRHDVRTASWIPRLQDQLLPTIAVQVGRARQPEVVHAFPCRLPESPSSEVVRTQSPLAERKNGLGVSSPPRSTGTSAACVLRVS